jgi:hypothetical protein
MRLHLRYTPSPNFVGIDRSSCPDKAEMGGGLKT